MARLALLRTSRKARIPPLPGPIEASCIFACGTRRGKLLLAISILPPFPTLPFFRTGAHVRHVWGDNLYSDT